ncbi:hypothetical protein QJS10_CPA08g00962 [Acorus calamus]|uniref:RNase H type-1 domain-containing protein n=1 Tax=Acorus calamus TaxID=4465 RepID=A0AAV9EE34_ACOCL|nr:hypothetical protein QJS10_CPA08g00962 [Acorus calamus]
MDCLFWNIRGVNSKEKQIDVKNFLARHSSPIISLVETKVALSNAVLIKNRILPQYQLLNPSLNGRIWLLWQQSVVDIELLSYSDQFLHCKVKPTSSQASFYHTTIYGSNNAAERISLWRDLRALAQGIGNAQWIMGGDFNEVRYSHEKMGGRRAHTRRMDKFNDCISECSLQDLKALGSHFSWSNHQTNRIVCKLDRILVNLPWLLHNANGYVQYLAEGLSDHSVLKVSAQPDFPSGPRPFKYFQAWEHHPQFVDVVARAWRQNFSGSPMFRLVRKLQHLKTVLKDWNKEVFGPLHSQLQSSRKKMEELQLASLNRPANNALLAQAAVAKDNYLVLLRREETFLRQKSRQTWLSDGDRNSKFFYSSIKARIAHNTLRKVQLANGTISEDHALIKDHAVTYYQKLLNAEHSHPIQHAVNWDTVCLPKEEGGLGLRRLGEWNDAAMGVRFWEIASNQPSLWATWIRRKYLKKKNVWTAFPSTTGTLVWKRILKAGEWIRVKTKYIIFQGNSINLWNDPWLNGHGLKHHFHGQTLLYWGPPNVATVNKFIVDGKWRKPHRWPTEFDHLWETILEIDIGGAGPDILIWTGAKLGVVNYNTAWHHVRSRRPSLDWTKAIWNPIQPPRRSFLCWQACLNRLPTLHRLKNHQLVQDDRCLLCSSGTEDVTHLFLHCSFSAFVWAAILKSLGLSRVRQLSLLNQFSWFSSIGKSITEKKVMQFLLTQIMWSLWLERNARLFRHQKCPKTILVRRILTVTSNAFKEMYFEDSFSPLSKAMCKVFGLNIVEKQSTTKEVIWQPPQEGWIKINSDGSKADDRFAYGALIRDHRGDCLQALTARVRAASINILELKGLVEGLSLCSSLITPRIWLETDSTTVVAWIQGKGHVPWTAFRDLRRFHCLTSSLCEWKVSHTYREGNKAADLLAAHQSLMGFTIYEPPLFWEELQLVLKEDKEGKVQLRTQ